MAYCSKCGKEINDEAVICVHCGCAVGSVPKQSVSTQQNGGHAGYAVLGFFIPLIGFILWLMWKDQEPAKAHSAGKGALSGMIFSVVVGILYGVFAGALVSSMLY